MAMHHAEKIKNSETRTSFEFLCKSLFVTSLFHLLAYLLRKQYLQLFSLSFRCITPS